MRDRRDTSSAPDVIDKDRLRRELAAEYAGDEVKPRQSSRRLARLWVVLLVVFVSGLLLETTVIMPDNAWVYVNMQQEVFYSPPYLQAIGQDGQGLVLTTAAMAAKMKCRPDKRALELGYFTQAGRSLSGGFLEKMGLLSPLKNRWNRDGTWNW